MNKTYRSNNTTVKALCNVNMHIPKGCFATLIGESGSGKSTLMNLAGCLDRPDSGEILIDGESIIGLRDDAAAEFRLRKIGFVFQSFYLQNNMTAIDNVILPLMLSGVPKKKREKRGKLLLEQLGLSERMHHTPPQLSGGQRQRVAIARALACDPPLILADEPTGNLDSVSAENIINLLKSLSEKGITVLMVTHNPNHALAADLSYTIKDGRPE